MKSEKTKQHGPADKQEIPKAETEAKVMATDPLAGDDILANFYRPANKPEAKPPEKTKPEHYRVVCISLYTEDIEKLNQFVKELKRRGHSKANKSQVIRAALEQLNLDRVPKIR